MIKLVIIGVCALGISLGFATAKSAALSANPEMAIFGALISSVFSAALSVTLLKDR